MSPQKSNPTRRDLLAAGGAIVAAVGVVSRTAAQEAPDLAGKAALITGASSGFGRLTALHLARHGATVIASMRNFRGGARPEAQELADIASAEKLKLSVVEIDVTNDAQVAAGVARAEEIAGRGLDLLLNNAGIGIAGPVEIHNHDQIMKQFNTNFFGYHRMARAALPKMRARREGLIICISSQLGRMILPNIGVYCGTKFAIEGMFEAMAYELAPTGVEVTIIQPGGYPTKIWDNGARYFEELIATVDEERKAAYAGHIQLAQGYFGSGGSTDPMDVARAIGELLATPVGKRPLRRPVHPNTQVTVAANAAMAQVQAAVLGGGRYRDWHVAVTD